MCRHNCKKEFSNKEQILAMVPDAVKRAEFKAELTRIGDEKMAHRLGAEPSTKRAKY